jgi:RNA polymerase sigma factor (sigma-70 family)
MLEKKDLEILLAYRERQTDKAIKLLLHHYQYPIYRHVSAMLKHQADTEDVVQMVFTKAWKGLAFFREESKISTWLYRIATNECITFLKKKNRYRTEEIQENHFFDNQVVNEAFELTSDELWKKFEEAMDELPARQKQVFSLRYFDELPYEEISKITGITLGALKASYHHAMEKIKNKIKND